MQRSNLTYINSGLGFSTCCRLIDEFLLTRPQSQTLHLIITTRDGRKNSDTLQRLHKHVLKNNTAADGSPLSKSLLDKRLQLEGQLLDLCSLVTVKALAKRLLDRGTRIDVLVLNAGIGGWSGMNWPLAAWSMATDFLNACTYPVYKLGYIGRVLPSQVPGSTNARVAGVQGDGRGGAVDIKDDEPALGEVFTANVFGHYMLAHYLVPLLRPTTTSTSSSSSSSPHAGRIIWVSSIEAYAHALRLDDLQGLKTDAPYESSKRLTDLLALTSELQSTKPYTSGFFASDDRSDEDHDAERRPKMYVSHPGICGTSISGLNALLNLFTVWALYLARWLGSPWHTIDPYVGAVAPAWLALAPYATLEQHEQDGAKGKWGSSTDVGGNERVIMTEVSGWGWSGKVGETADGSMRSRKGRWKGMQDVTAESREEFEESGRQVWREMEELRVDWERRLEGV